MTNNQLLPTGNFLEITKYLVIKLTQIQSNNNHSWIKIFCSYRNCVDFENEIDETSDKKSVSKSASIKSAQSSSLSQPAQNARGNEKVRIHSTITNIDSDGGGITNHIGGKQNTYEHNIAGNSSSVLNSTIPSSETEPLVKNPTGNGAATHPVWMQPLLTIDVTLSLFLN